MKPFLVYILISIAILSGCKKDNSAPKVEIYILESFTVNASQTNPFTTSVSNVVLQDDPLVKDSDIQFYERSTTTFKLTKDIRPVIKDYSTDKAFAVTVDKKLVYVGLFHPAYLSSLSIGIATIDPIFFNNNSLQISFVNIDALHTEFDKRNDDQIINALRKTNRIR